MRGRRCIAAALFVASAGCSGSVSFEPNTEVAATPAPATRPTLGEIFRDGRYEFEDEPGAARTLERAAKRDPADLQPIDEVVAKRVDEQGLPNGMLALAFLLTNEASAVPDIWEKMLQAQAAGAGEAPEAGMLDDTQVAYTKTDVEHTLTIYYARDLVVSVTGPASTPRSALDDIGLYLLDAR